MGRERDRDDEADDPFLFAALKLQDGRPVAEVRKLLISQRGLSQDEAQTTVLNVYAAQRLQDGLKPSEVRKLLLAEKNVTPEQARAIVAELRASTTPSLAEHAGRSGGSVLRG